MKPFSISFNWIRNLNIIIRGKIAANGSLLMDIPVPKHLKTHFLICWFKTLGTFYTILICFFKLAMFERFNQ